MPWVSAVIRPDGRIFPCCDNTRAYQRNGEDIYLYKDSFAGALQSETAQELRRAMLEGKKHESCAICWKDEACGQKSKRFYSNHDFRGEMERVLAGNYEPDHPVFLDISPGNLCNMKCRICGPGISSRWDQDAEALGLGDNFVRNNAELRAMGQTESRRKILSWAGEGMWREMEEQLPHLRVIHMHGGEPFLIRRHFEMLERSVREGHSRKQALRYNSNGTIYPDHAMENIFPHFESTQIFLSIDDIGPRFEYQRHGGKWEAVLRNVDKFLAQKQVRIAICLTVSVFNIFHLFEILEFWRERKAEVFLNLLFGPAHLHIGNLPPAEKAALLRDFRARDLSRYEGVVLNNLDSVFQHLAAEADPEQWRIFLRETGRHDAHRRESCAATFPALAPYFAAQPG